MDTDIREQLDRSFGDGPAHPPLERELEAGRRALRRRRTLVTTAAAMVVAILGTSYAVAASGPTTDAGSRVAVQPTETPTPTPTPTEVPWTGNDPVRYVDNELQVRPGVTVHERIENPYGYTLPDRSDGLDLTFRGHRTWVLAELTGNGGGLMMSEPSNGWASFADWVADQVASAQGGEGGSGWPETMRLAGDGSVVAAPGNTVLQRTDDPRLGASFAPPGTPTGAALVEVGGSSQAYFVVWRVIDGEIDVITTPPRDVVGATWDELLGFAQARYASGEGLR